MSEDWDDDERAPTGHDIHFLERLNERIDYERADLALRLHRDAPFVRAIVADEQPNAARAAIALDEGALPPYLVVERGGAFVTCLQAGMRPNDETPVVAWERLQIHLNRAALHAERTARANELLKNQRAARALLQGVHEAGARLSREHVAQLAVLAPFLERYYLAQLVELFPRVAATAPHVIRLRQASPSVEAKLHRFWNRYHAVGHFLVLSTLGGKRALSVWDEWRDEIEERRARRAAHGDTTVKEFDPWRGIYLEPAKIGHGFMALRSYWALGRAGRLAVPSMKRMASEATNIIQWMNATYAMLAIGKRHRDLRGELSRAVGPAKLPDALRAEQSIVGWAGYMQELMEGDWVADDAPPGALEARIQVAAETIVAQRERGLKNEEQPGDDCSTARLAYLKCDFTDLKEDHAILGLAVALASSLPPEQLYYPHDDLALAPAFTGEAAIALAKFAPPPPTQVRSVEKIGRNTPCPCGSGKKYKLCCGTN